MSNDTFWALIDEQIAALTKAGSADEVVKILASPEGVADGFFAGSGGDATVRDALFAAGWKPVWTEASYYYAMVAPDGSTITYVEGDIYKETLAPVH